MCSYIGVFKRKESKYRMTSKQMESFMKLVSGHMALDQYGKTRIRSYYFDTPWHEIITRSLDKPLYKEKLRVREYGDASYDSRVFVELKKKYKGIVYKRRIGMSQMAARAFIDGTPYEQACEEHPLPCHGDDISQVNIQISREIQSFIGRYDQLAPAMLVEVDRQAYTEKPVDSDVQSGDSNDRNMAVVDRELRMTIDSNAVCTPLDDDFREIGPVRILNPDECLLEIKAVGSYPIWLVDALNTVGAYPASFSKYGEAYKLCVLSRLGTGAKAMDGGGRLRLGENERSGCDWLNDVRWRESWADEAKTTRELGGNAVACAPCWDSGSYRHADAAWQSSDNPERFSNGALTSTSTVDSEYACAPAYALI